MRITKKDWASAGLTQAAVAKIVAVPRQTIHMWGVHTPNQSTRSRMLMVLNAFPEKRDSILGVYRARLSEETYVELTTLLDNPQPEVVPQEMRVYQVIHNYIKTVASSEPVYEALNCIMTDLKISKDELLETLRIHL